MIWPRRRPSLPNNTETTQENAMTLTEAPPVATSSPERTEAEARLTRAGEFVTDALRDSVLAQADAQAKAREFADTLTAAREALIGAAGRYDHEQMVGAASRYASLTTAAEFLPPVPPVDLAAEDASLARGRALIEAARATIPTSPVLSFTLELSAYKSLPQFVRQLEPPAYTRADVNLAAAVAEWSERAQSIIRGLAAWERSSELHQSDVLGQLAMVPALVHQAADFARDGADLSTRVDTANRARHEAGDEWVHGSPENRYVASNVTPATEALVEHRRRMAGLPPATNPRSGNR
jgi:hypothetical protein